MGGDCQRTGACAHGNRGGQHDGSTALSGQRGWVPGARGGGGVSEVLFRKNRPQDAPHQTGTVARSERSGARLVESFVGRLARTLVGTLVRRTVGRFEGRFEEMFEGMFDSERLNMPMNSELLSPGAA